MFSFAGKARFLDFLTTAWMTISQWKVWLRKQIQWKNTDPVGLHNCPMVYHSEWESNSFNLPLCIPSRPSLVKGPKAARSVKLLLIDLIFLSAVAVQIAERNTDDLHGAWSGHENFVHSHIQYMFVSVYAHICTRVCIYIYTRIIYIYYVCVIDLQSDRWPSRVEEQPSSDQTEL